MIPAKTVQQQEVSDVLVRSRVIWLYMSIRSFLAAIFPNYQVTTQLIIRWWAAQQNLFKVARYRLLPRCTHTPFRQECTEGLLLVETFHMVTDHRRHPTFFLDDRPFYTLHHQRKLLSLHILSPSLLDGRQTIWE